MAKTYPVVDVIITVYNGAPFLEEAIQSVLGQTYASINLIVVDDGSEDLSAAVAAQIPGVRVLQQPHRGIGAALNLALHHTCGAFLAFLDADDRWLHDKLEKQVGTLEAEPALDIVFGHVRQFFQSDQANGDSAWVGAAQPGISRIAMLVRHKAFAQVGTFAEERTVHSFVDWYARACEVGLRPLMLPDVVAERRIHVNNLGRRTPAAQRESYLQALRMSVARRRPTDAASGST